MKISFCSMNAFHISWYNYEIAHRFWDSVLLMSFQMTAKIITWNTTKMTPILLDNKKPWWQLRCTTQLTQMTTLVETQMTTQIQIVGAFIFSVSKVVICVVIGCCQDTVSILLIENFIFSKKESSYFTYSKFYFLLFRFFENLIQVGGFYCN
jgi:hypothetical protein